MPMKPYLKLTCHAMFLCLVVVILFPPSNIPEDINRLYKESSKDFLNNPESPRCRTIQAWVPGEREAITIGGMIFIESYNRPLIVHEMVHVRQQRDGIYIIFWAKYLLEIIDKGYRSVSFEKEAFKVSRRAAYILGSPSKLH